MVDKKILDQNIELLNNSFKKRNINVDINQLLSLFNKYKKMKIEIENINGQINQLSKEIALLLKDNDTKKIELNKQKASDLNLQYLAKKDEFKLIEDELNSKLLSLPNILCENVPYGKDESDNIEVFKFLEPRKFDFNFLAHWDLCEKKEMIDLERAAKITGSRFSIYKNKGAMLMNALQQFTVDQHYSDGYQFYLLPVIINTSSLIGTGQLPKFSDDLFKLTDHDYYLSPTLEVQLSNLYRDEIIEEQKLPLRFFSTGVNFRSEAGSAGRDTKGLIRQHQFLKTELVYISSPENSYEMLEEMVNQAEKILKLLKLPYRKILLCSGDTGFSSAKTYDLEVWMPSYNSYKEISSCSNCTDFQARRLKLRYKKSDKSNQLVHTLNGTGVALDRLFAAVCENYQNQDLSITIPEVLKKYLPFDKI